jgi:hypothetical protein
MINCCQRFVSKAKNEVFLSGYSVALVQSMVTVAQKMVLQTV